MTLASDPSTELTVDGLIQSAYELAGLTNPLVAPSAAQLGQGRRFLNAILNSLQAKGVNVRHQSFYEATVASGDTSVTLPSTVFSVAGPAMWVPSSGAETPVVEIAQQTYQEIPNKSATGRPYLYYPARSGSSWVVYPWPVPSEDATLRLTVVELGMSASGGSNNFDADRHWEAYLMYELAAWLCRSHSKLAQSALYDAKALDEFRSARRASTEGPGSQVYLTHGRSS